ncbi:hypothetical protein O6H91_01G075100 [Diphasiastrum complanatum]|uniref:Uncharacterized protein n=1 Tax=Diphasiastrum complanatum TaxID=34168 RepID=A0ACC2ESB7_DIPCM|nr:hypothetical protein O6H91_01G075100 [Diphasiastrum complanatum]
MDDAHQIVVLALERAGIALPPGVVTIHDVESAALTSICSQAVAMIKKAGEDEAFEGAPASHALPQLMSERFRFCMDLAASVQKLGYREDISFHQFLYPSETSTYKLLRFLLEKLSTASANSSARSSSRGQGRPARKGGVAIRATDIQATVKRALQSWLEGTHEEGNSYGMNLAKNLDQIHSGQGFMRLKTVSKDEGQLQSSSMKVKSSFLKAVEFSDTQVRLPCTCVARQVVSASEKSKESESSLHTASFAENYVSEDGIAKLEERLTSLVISAEKLEIESTEAEQRASTLEKTLVDILESLKLFNKQAKVMQKALDMAFNSSKSPKDSLEAYKQVVADRGEHLSTHKLDRERTMTSLKESIQDLERTAQTGKSGIDYKFNLIEEMRQGCTATMTKIYSSDCREDEIAKVKLALEKSPKQAARSTYVRRITELVKNSKKQDADIAQIIRETRNLQRESNAVQNRLHRTHVLVDELVFRF